jgi:hypothetical protein
MGKEHGVEPGGPCAEGPAIQFLRAGFSLEKSAVNEHPGPPAFNEVG